MSEPLTDNQKAATFIGWKPEDDPPVRCTNAYHQRTGSITIPASVSYARCLDCRSNCPDMTKPENYIRALETLPALSELTFGIDENGHYCHYGFNTEARFGYDAPSFGEAAMKVLAALYDAEHPK